MIVNGSVRLDYQRRLLNFCIIATIPAAKTEYQLVSRRHSIGETGDQTTVAIPWPTCPLKFLAIAINLTTVLGVP
jgi:hypothetical protein